MKLILASKSPRRKEILAKHGYEFEAVTADFDEVKYDDNPERTARENALGKAKAVFYSLKDKDAVVLGADTIVCFGGKILGKPKDKNHAKAMLKTLSGNTHTVITGYALINDDEAKIGTEKSEVTFNILSDELIEEYVESGSPLDKAGAYGIQDSYPIVKSYTGELNNIIGLPIKEVKKILDKIL